MESIPDGGLEENHRKRTTRGQVCTLFLRDDKSVRAARKYRAMDKWHTIIRRERRLRGLSQSDLAEKLGCDTRTVGRWERGEAFPIPFFIGKMAQLFEKDAAALGLLEPESPATPNAFWGDAPDVTRFFGRADELARLKRWIKQEECRVIALLGIGGCGKTTLARVVATEFSAAYDGVFWYALHNAPPLEHLLERFFQRFHPAGLDEQPRAINEQLSMLVDLLTRHRYLLIVDNVESILQGGQRAGQYLPGYEGYGMFFRRLGEARHQSCLLLTSREKPGEIAYLEGDAAPVRSLSLPGLGTESGQMLLQDQALSGDSTDWQALVLLYLGNPLVLKLVSGFIRDLFEGDIAAFLSEGVSVFDGIQDVLDQQFQRLSPIEQDILFWLAIEREPVTLATVSRNMTTTLSRPQFFEAAESLRRRSILEAHSERRFALQPVILEYMTARLLASMSTALIAGDLDTLGRYALLQAQASDYVRESQVRLLLAPIVARLHDALDERGTRQHLRDLFEHLQSAPRTATDYRAGNLLNLLVFLNESLRGLKAARLHVRQAYFRGVDLPQVDFSHANLSTCAFTDTFACILCLAMTRDERLLAAGMTTGEVRIWQAGDMTPLYACQAHTEEIRSVAFSPDGGLLASASEDHTIRLWDTRNGRCRTVLHAHSDMLRSVVFSPDGQFLASAGEDESVRVWEVATDRLLHTLAGHVGRVRTLAFHGQSALLASGGDDGMIRLWDGANGEARTTIEGQGGFVHTLAFHPGTEILASGSEDCAIRFWDARSGALLKVLEHHRARVRTLAFSADGRYLASGDDDGALSLWDTTTRQLLRDLQGHTHRVWTLVFAATAETLISASEDDTLRWWETENGRCLRLLRGYTDLIRAVAFSPDGRILASASDDRTIRLWSVQTGHWLRVLRGHLNRVRTIAISEDGRLLASGSEDETVRLWDPATGRCLRVLNGHTHLLRSLAFDRHSLRLLSCGYDMRVHLWEVASGRLLRTWDASHQGRLNAVAFHPHGQLFASGGEQPVVQIWNLEEGAPLLSLQGHTHRVWSLAFSPDGALLASCGDDQSVRLWETASWRCQRVMQGHQAWVRSVAFSPDATLVASGSHDQSVRIWEVTTGACLHVLSGHSGFIMSVAFSQDGRYLASGSDDGTVRLWEIVTGSCLRVFRRERPYEGMNITGVRGLSQGQKDALRLLGAIDDEA